MIRKKQLLIILINIILILGMRYIDVSNYIVKYLPNNCNNWIYEAVSLISYMKYYIYMCILYVSICKLEHHKIYIKRFFNILIYLLIGICLDYAVYQIVDLFFLPDVYDSENMASAVILCMTRIATAATYVIKMCIFMVFCKSCYTSKNIEVSKNYKVIKIIVNALFISYIIYSIVVYCMEVRDYNNLNLYSMVAMFKTDWHIIISNIFVAIQSTLILLMFESKYRGKDEY